MNVVPARLLVCAALLLVVPSLAAAEEKVPAFIARSASGATATGPLRSIGENWSVELGNTRIAGEELLSLRRVGVSLPEFPIGMHVVLANGDHLPGQVEALAGESLRFRPAWGTDNTLKLPLTRVSLLWLVPPDGTRHADTLRRRLMAGKRKRDTVYLRNGDILEGIVNRLDATKLYLEVDRKEVAVALHERVAIIAFSTDLVRVAKPKETYAHLVLANGGRLSLAAATADARELRGRTLFSAEVRLPLEQIVSLDLRQGRAVYLSDLQPSRYEFTPYLDERWPYQRDASVLDRDLRLGGNTYDKGLGTHSECRLTYDLSGGYQWFEAIVGLDDRSGRRGNAVIQVLVDGQPRALDGGPALTGTSKPRPLRVDVSGAKTLTLVTAFGKGGPVQDHVDWAEARLIKVP
jgi:sRNA-binding regulator protein Hfq